MISFLKRLKNQKIAIDTMIFVYAFEDHPAHASFLRSFFSALEKGEMESVTSSVTITECLTQPYRVKDFALAAQYMALFRNFPHLSVVPVTDDIAERAAFLRASQNLKTPDALQLATALLSGANFFLTNDQSLSSIQDVPILILDRLF
ncbi:MAG TPA: PIN domain-containing protein [Thermodesulfobacteriota bacterium]|nr:PIN domain-containing protein [Thermodesulfobacteriota bacterium]